MEESGFLLARQHGLVSVSLKEAHQLAQETNSTLADAAELLLTSADISEPGSMAFSPVEESDGLLTSGGGELDGFLLSHQWRSVRWLPHQWRRVTTFEYQSTNVIVLDVVQLSCSTAASREASQ